VTSQRGLGQSPQKSRQNNQPCIFKDQRNAGQMRPMSKMEQYQVRARHNRCCSRNKGNCNGPKTTTVVQNKKKRNSGRETMSKQQSCKDRPTSAAHVKRARSLKQTGCVQKKLQEARTGENRKKNADRCCPVNAEAWKRKESFQRNTGEASWSSYGVANRGADDPSDLAKDCGRCSSCGIGCQRISNTAS